MSAVLRVLPHTAAPTVVQSASWSPRRTVNSAAALIGALRASPGDRDKPVRLLQDADSWRVLVAKFGLGEDTERQPCVQHERQALRVVARAPTPHIVREVWGAACQEPDRLLPSSVCCLEFVEPWGSIHTMRQLAAKGSDAQWREAILQVVFTLLALQATFPGFRHNDLKADNVLITAPPADMAQHGTVYAVDARSCVGLPEAARVRRVWRLPRPQLHVKIIDFELASTPEDSTLRSAVVASAASQ